MEPGLTKKALKIKDADDSEAFLLFRRFVFHGYSLQNLLRAIEASLSDVMDETSEFRQPQQTRTIKKACEVLAEVDEDRPSRMLAFADQMFRCMRGIFRLLEVAEEHRTLLFSAKMISRARQELLSKLRDVDQELALIRTKQVEWMLLLSRAAALDAEALACGSPSAWLKRCESPPRVEPPPP